MAIAGARGRSAVIPRHQTVLFIFLLAASAIMGVLLWNQLRRSHDRLLHGENSAPTQAPQVAAAEQVTLMVANDADNTVQPRLLTLPLPQNPEARARAILGKLLDFYATPIATHPVPGGASSISPGLSCSHRGFQRERDAKRSRACGGQPDGQLCGQPSCRLGD